MIDRMLHLYPIRTRIYQSREYSLDLVRYCPDYIFVFGDNLLHAGRGGTAKIRYLKNTFGIPTKRFPSNDERAFFRDRKDEVEEIEKSLKNLLQLFNNGSELVFPTGGIGTGLAKLEEKSPKIFSYLNNFLSDNFHIDNGKDYLSEYVQSFEKVMNEFKSTP